jgi:drug/metabolite transporter (DMT)-like permease
LVLAFGLLVKIISDNIDDPKTLWLATAILGGFIAALMGILFLISNMKTKNYSSMVEASAKMFTSMGVALLALGVALGLIGGVVKEHADSPEQLFLAVGLIGLMLLVMAGFLAILTKMPTNQAKKFDNAAKFFASMALFVIGFAVSFGLMAEALRRAEENNVDPKFILGALLIMTALIGIIALIAGSGGMAAGGAMMIMAVGVVALAAGFLIFAKAMRELAEVDSDKIDSLIKVFGKNWLKLIAGGVGLTVFAAGATAMTIALVALAGALFLLGIALQPVMPLLTMLMEKF